MGNSTADDAGVFRLRDDLALVHTVDFFTPIVDDPYSFGQIAAANALSDVYAMGGRPIVAMNICCLPVKELGVELLREVIRGGMDKVAEAGAVVVGGHSVTDSELKYGLAVTGIVHPERVITNAGLKPGEALILTKPLGTGIIATALKAGLASPGAVERAIRVMAQLNAPAMEVMVALGVKGATDITGFGLLGHGLEMARASGVGLVIQAREVPVLAEAREMASMGLVPAGTHANRSWCESSIREQGRPDPILRDILSDAQTSGGILMGVQEDLAEQAIEMLRAKGAEAQVIGRVIPAPPGTITVIY